MAVAVGEKGEGVGAWAVRRAVINKAEFPARESEGNAAARRAGRQDCGTVVALRVSCETILRAAGTVRG